MPTKPTSIAPVYRYFTADLLTNEILAEIPLRGVQYERALKAAGKFKGRIPITAETDSMDLWNSTMPGVTALYVVRNGVCVWGGIIWGRGYQLSTKDLAISASEFTSYAYHRKIWKTWNHQYGGTVGYTTDDGWRVVLDSGSSVVPKAGSTVKLEYYEPENFKYNGYYRVAETPAPTSDGFSLVSGFAVADLVSREKANNTYTYYTAENHGFTTGDSVTLTLTTIDGVVQGSPVVAEFKIDAPDGAASNWFRVTASSGTTPLEVVDGTAARTLPVGTYNDVTVTVRLDAFDYIRTLIDAMFEDFVGTDFPNVYIEPGISYAFDVVEKSAASGYAIIETAQPHGIAPGQALQIQDVGTDFDGEFEVTDTPSPTTLVYESGGTLSPTAVSVLNGTVSQLNMSKGLARLTTQSAHGFKPGQTVLVNLGDSFTDFNGEWTIHDVPTPTTFRYETFTSNSYQSFTLVDASTAVSGDPANQVTRAEVKSNVVTLELRDPVIYSAADSVTVSNVNRTVEIEEKSLDAPNSLATVITKEDHGFRVGDTVSLNGLSDIATVGLRTSTTSSTTMTTASPHNFRVGDSVTISGSDTFKVMNKALTSNVVTLTTAVNHNIPVSTEITVSDINDIMTVTGKSMTDGVVTLTTATHNIQVNDSVTVTGIVDAWAAISKQVTNGVVTLTLSRPHNLLVGQKIKVSGMGMPYDGTEIKIDEITTTRIVYKIDAKYWSEQRRAAARKGKTLIIPMNLPLSKTTGTITAPDSYFNGQYIVTARTNTTISYWRGGNDMLAVAATGKITAPSVMNGTYTVTARTNTTLSYAKTANNSASVAVPQPTKEDQPQPRITLDSIHSGARTITKVTSNTFVFTQSLPAAMSQKVRLYARRASIFNGNRTITGVPTGDAFTFSLPGYTASMVEKSVTSPAFATNTTIYNGTFTITAVDTVRNTITYAKTLDDYGSKAVPSLGTAAVHPVVIVSSFGPYPANADIGMGYDTQTYTGINLEPTPYRGFELKSVGEALDKYSDNINGFEYRIDCAYDVENDRFTKTFVMLPINLPDPPAAGEVSPLSRFGADKLVFEYPGGNIVEASIEESAEESATRFFAVGTTELGPDVGPNIGIASSEELLRGKDGRRWPLLDASETIDDVDDENELYAYAQRYLSESAPPYTSLTLTLNGSIAPLVGDYKPGDWCSLIIDDPFAKMRLQSELEPRDDVLVRKISSFQVRVPDGVTFPETVTLNLVAEWEVDKRG